MKKHFKGFTLVECLVALGILGIASLTMADIYAGVARRNKMNYLINTSLSNQMAYVEKQTGSEAYELKYNGSTGTKPPDGNNNGQKAYVQIVRKDDTKPNNRDPEQAYSFPVDVYVLKSRNADDQALDKRQKEDIYNGGGANNANVGNTHGYGEADYNLRYKYVVGHTS
ncbi:MAG: prepilin-type N-terminal cleavage/methylation domain-containing protein [Oscillospiraceae bacterium]|nr:prepilin-type N-terminal cleavage/methylation domain-containing protein [Oscillospiraceae bacterium]